MPRLSGPCVTPICMSAWRSGSSDQRSGPSRSLGIPPPRSVACAAVAGPHGSSESERCEPGARDASWVPLQGALGRPGPEQMIKESVSGQRASSRKSSSEAPTADQEKPARQLQGVARVVGRRGRWSADGDGSHCAVNAAVTGCPAGQPSTAAVSGLSVSCSAIGGGAAPRSRWTRLCHHTGIPAAPAPMRSFGEPATNSTASGATANSSSA